MNKYIKPFLVFEWITVLGASTAAYIRWGFPLYICIGIVLLGVILTLYFSKRYEKKSINKSQ
ncbi:hypothetical protein OCO53_27410 [Peribacillus frigoritolerans]|uniref:hypothetical protein n=1 Tax=Peribacillus frigoritolerans TaxID=450367 RepID=UPI0021D32B1F|nr:hypothetical protein [Peribacillus frigoritolerans]MCU6604141.1 hypothetical protein [Peribacillus frigoritolerans]